jgi:hypothetical protein
MTLPWTLICAVYMVSLLVEVALKVLVNHAGVCEVVGVGLQLIGITVLKPQVLLVIIKRSDFIRPAIAVALNQVFVISGAKCIGYHVENFRVSATLH